MLKIRRRDPTSRDPLDEYEAVRATVSADAPLRCVSCGAKAKGLSEFHDPYCWDCLAERTFNRREK